jgi:2-polyprenyl-6-methoxyphenol hydroxylase-like FAD-dependent oxidoreductase
MALEDAIVLAGMLETCDDSSQATFAAYEAKRRPRAEKVVAEDDEMGIGRRRTPCPIQRLMMPLFLKFAPSHQDIYGYDAGWDDEPMLQRAETPVECQTGR